MIFGDEVAARSLAYLDKRAADKKPFFLWHNSSRQHVFIHLKEEARGQSRADREDVYGNGLKEHDGHVGQLLDKLKQTGLDRNTIAIYTTDNGAYQYMRPEGGTTPFRGDKGTTWEGGVRVPFIIRWPGEPAGRVSSEIVDMTDLPPTLAAAAGEASVADKLKKGASHGGRDDKVHLDGFDQTARFTGKGEESARSFVFYYDETVLTAIRYQQFKVTFSAKFGNRWDSPLESLGGPLITNILMDPFERQTSDLNRQYAEHKAWVLTPIVGIAMQHLQTFKDFPIRQLGMSADVGKTVEGVQGQILKLEKANNGSRDRWSSPGHRNPSRGRGSFHGLSTGDSSFTYILIYQILSYFLFPQIIIIIHRP